MDILLTHAWFLANDPHEAAVMKPYAPLGLMSIAAYLKSQDFAVGLFDSTFQDMEAFKALVLKERPSVVGIYLTLMTKPAGLQMIEFCRQQNIWVVLGGPEPPHYARQYLERGADVVVIGEGEVTLEELIPALIQRGRAGLHQVKGIAFLDDFGALIHTDTRPFIQNLDSLPMPDRGGLNLRLYLDAWKTHHGASSLNLVTARGCPYTCRWCSHSVYGESHRRRSPGVMAEEVEQIIGDYAPDQAWYVDDVFTINHRWLRDYAAELKRRNLHLPFECISRADRLNEEVVALLAEMGCNRLWIGSESGSQAILNAMDRKTNVQEVQAMTHLLKNHGIQTGMFIMLGYEGETETDLEETLHHLKIANPDLFLSTVAYPIKGTAYYQQVKDRIIEPGPWESYTDRDLIIAGRHSRRYFSFATRWLVNEVNLHRAQSEPPKDLKHYPRLAKMKANALLGRAGMRLTAHEQEGPSGPSGRGWYDEQRAAVGS
jgi:radical SAM superfamily enzyme YgiQ (UPF0313 family)